MNYPELSVDVSNANNNNNQISLFVSPPLQEELLPEKLLRISKEGIVTELNVKFEPLNTLVQAFPDPLEQEKTPEYRNKSSNLEEIPNSDREISITIFRERLGEEAILWAVRGAGVGNQPSQEKPWGISRINAGINAKGIYSDANKKNKVYAFVLDTGIDHDHPDLNVDLKYAFDAFTFGNGGNYSDGNGHGTHVAGTIGAIDNEIGVVGVAAGIKLVPVKVLNSRGAGTYSGVRAGINHVANTVFSLNNDADPNNDIKAVANMSLGGYFNDPLNQAIKNAVALNIDPITGEANLKFVLAAGNSNDYAGNYSPASASNNEPDIFAIGAFDKKDQSAYFSNYGGPNNLVDYFMPGVAVKSTWKDGNYKTISGTSMAAPHYAGLVALEMAGLATLGIETDAIAKNGSRYDVAGVA